MLYLITKSKETRNKFQKIVLFASKGEMVRSLEEKKIFLSKSNLKQKSSLPCNRQITCAQNILSASEAHEKLNFTREIDTK